MKSPVVLALLIPCIAGTGTLLQLILSPNNFFMETRIVLLLRLGKSHQDLPGLLTAYYILASYSSITPLIFNWQSSNVAGHTKKTTVRVFFNRHFVYYK